MLIHQEPQRGSSNGHIYSAHVQTRYDCFDRSGLVVSWLLCLFLDRPDQTDRWCLEKRTPKQTSNLKFWTLLLRTTDAYLNLYTGPTTLGGRADIKEDAGGP
jgi:hypothetical protein